MLYFRFKPFKTKNIFLFISQHNCDSHSSLWIIISFFPILHVTIARRNYVRHRTGDEFLPLIKPLTKFSLTAAESTVSHEIVWVTWALSATCSPLLGAQLPVVKDNSGMMQSGDLGRRPPCKELCENKPWEEGLFSLAWELCELSGSCLSNVVGMLFPGCHLTDLDLLTWFSGLTFNLPSHYRFAWQSLDRWLNLVAVTSPDSDPDTLTSFQITSHHFALVLWSGLLGDPNSHNQPILHALRSYSGVVPLSVKTLPLTVLPSPSIPRWPSLAQQPTLAAPWHPESHCPSSPVFSFSFAFFLSLIPLIIPAFLAFYTHEAWRSLFSLQFFSRLLF